MVYLGIFDKAETYYTRANRDIRKGKLQNAVENFDRSLKVNPNYYKSWHGKGVALTRLKKFNEGFACYNKTLEIEPEYSLCLWNKLLLLILYIKNYEEALVCCDKLLNMNKMTLKKGLEGSRIKYPDIYPDIWNNKGFALFNLENYDEAINCYDKALELNSSHLVAQKNKKVVETKKLQQTQNTEENSLDILTPINPLDEIKKAKELQEAGVISKEDFENLKAKSRENITSKKVFLY